MRYRFYVDGKLKKSSEVTKEIGLKWMNNVQADWERGLQEPIKPGEFDPNNAVFIDRKSLEELEIHTTGGRKLVWKLVD